MMHDRGTEKELPFMGKPEKGDHPGLWRRPEENREREELFLNLNKGLRELAREVESDASGLTAGQREEARSSIHLFYKNFLEGREKDVSVLLREEMIPAKEQHYNRNQNMPPEVLPKTPEEADRWGWDNGVASDCHQFTSLDRSNVKYVSPDGKMEVIFDKNGNVVTASEDCGTYNFASPMEDPIGHFYKDVLPWLVWGNDENDSTDMHMRLRSFVIDGGMNMIREKLNNEEPAESMWLE